MADEMVSHDHEVTSKYKDRLAVSDGAYGRAFIKYRPNMELIWIRGKWVTPIQYQVMKVAVANEGETLTATIIANSLGVAVSTVTRALLKLAALKLVAFDVIRGRSGGIHFLSTSWADLKARARTAWAKINEQRLKTWDRYLRKLDESRYFWSGLNVATI
jgi:predicted transcriptional regulator